MSIKVFVEGGGDHNKNLQTECRKGFSEFFAKAGLTGRLPRIVACGGRQRAFKNFQISRKQGEPTLLLVDSESQVRTTPWDHVREVDNWPRPAGATDDQLHFMVATMEAWLHADKKALEQYYGECFRRNGLSQRPDVENISKADLLDGLKRATAPCSNGEYSKSDDSFKILSKLDPAKVRSASVHAERLAVLDRACQR